MAYKDIIQQRAFQLSWITTRKRQYLDRLGACIFCGSQDTQIHHLDKNAKESHRIWSWKDRRIEAELAKCVALCKFCHKIFHALERRKAIKHGTTGCYRLGCRCLDCQDANRDQKRREKQRKITQALTQAFPTKENLYEQKT